MIDTTLKHNRSDKHKTMHVLCILINLFVAYGHDLILLFETMRVVLVGSVTCVVDYYSTICSSYILYFLIIIINIIIIIIIINKIIMIIIINNLMIEAAVGWKSIL